jgi:hypothetical protein
MIPSKQNTITWRKIKWKNKKTKQHNNSLKQRITTPKN